MEYDAVAAKKGFTLRDDAKKAYEIGQWLQPSPGDAPPVRLYCLNELAIKVVDGGPWRYNNMYAR